MSRTSARISSAARAAVSAGHVIFAVIDAEDDDDGTGFIIEVPFPTTYRMAFRLNGTTPLYTSSRFGRDLQRSLGNQPGYSLLWSYQFNHRFNLHVTPEAMRATQHSNQELGERVIGLPQLACLIIESTIQRARRDPRRWITTHLRR